MGAERPPIILNVDDDEAGRYATTRALQRAGFEVREAGTGAEGLRLAADGPDLVILDVNLPDMSGLEVCRRLKSSPGTASVPVLHLSATEIDIEDRVEGLESGADGYLIQPVAAVELVATVKALLRTRRAEESANAAARQWQATFDAISDGVCLLDGRDVVIRCNRALESLLGRPAANIRGCTWADVAPGSAAAEMTRLLRDVREKGWRHVIELPAVDRWLRVAADPVAGTDREPAGAVLTLTDITARRLAEEERTRLLARARKSRMEAERASQRLRDLQTVTDAALAHLSVDDLLRELLQRLHQILEVDAVAILFPTDDGRHLTLQAAFGQDGPLPNAPPIPIGAGIAGRVAQTRQPIAIEDLEPALRAGTGFQQSIRSLMAVPLMAKGRLVGVVQVGTVRPRHFAGDECQLLLRAADRMALGIDQARQYESEQRARAQAEAAQAAAEESSRRLLLLSETASQLLFSDDPLQFTQALYDRLSAELGLEVYLNYLAEEDGKSLRLAAHHGVPPDMVTTIQTLQFGESACGRVAQQRSAIVAEEVQSSLDPNIDLARSLGVTAYACHPLIAHDRLIGTLSFGTRTRERFNAEEVWLMEAVTDQVAMALERARLMNELQERAHELVMADQRKDQFLAMLAHELRNPLGAISNATQVIRLDGDMEPRLHEMRGVVERQVAQMGRLVNDLLDVSRITRGVVDLRLARVDLMQLIRETAQDHRAAVEQAGLALVVDVPEEPLWLMGDPARLSQVMGNLLHNATKFTDSGAVTIWARVDDAASEAVISVRDTGVGVEADLLPHIFQPFTQGDRSLDRRRGGLGLGLPLVAGLVQHHGGRVSAVSEGPGFGSEFTIRLPLSSAPAPAADPVAAATSTPSPGRRILVIEDNQDAAQSLCRLLRMFGHEVDVANTGPEGVARAQAQTPDVVLCDLGLPGMDGYQVAAELRRDPRTASARLIVVSGYGQEDDRRRSREAGFDVHLMKPINPEELEQILL